MFETSLKTEVADRAVHGDTRCLTALYANVTVAGKNASIEEHFQLAKRWYDRPPVKTWRDGRGRVPDYYFIGVRLFHVSAGAEFYFSLWCRYLDQNPDVTEYLRSVVNSPDSPATLEDRLQREALTRYTRGDRSRFPLP